MTVPGAVNSPAAASVLQQTRTQDLQRRAMPGYQGEYGEEQLLHGVPAVDPGKGQERTEWTNS